MDDFEIYDRISDTLMRFTNRITLEFVASLSYKRKDGSRSFFHSEWEKTSKYIGTSKSRTIRRNINYYFCINEKDNLGGGLILRPQDVAIILQVFEQQVFPWFQGSTRLFQIKDDKLVIIGKYSPAVYAQSTYNYISFTPLVYEYESGQFKEGVHVCLNRVDNCWDMTIDELYGFYYILKNTSMYNLAAEMANYVKTPPYGVNLGEIKGLGSGGAEFGDGMQFTHQVIKDTKQNQGGKGTNDFLNNL